MFLSRSRSPSFRDFAHRIFSEFSYLDIEISEFSDLAQIKKIPIPVKILSRNQLRLKKEIYLETESNQTRKSLRMEKIKVYSSQRNSNNFEMILSYMMQWSEKYEY